MTAHPLSDEQCSRARSALEASGGNVSSAAASLGVSRNRTPAACFGRPEPRGTVARLGVRPR
ncbi:MAG: hypothetical protein JOZ17_27190 [Acetobacteraceae bacterium]|nr:hypothetical protein [Acetobacteraceae bacterium]MBV8614863.1 hypothetical protein [Acetobacteraceae bacterium]